MSGPIDIAWSRELAANSRRHLALWTGAAVLMLAAHAGAAWLALQQMPEPFEQIAGGAFEVELAALGSEADQVSAGDVGETVEPVTAETVEAVETATPVEVMQPTEPVRPVVAARPVTAPAGARPVQTEATPVEARPAQQAASPIEVAPIEASRPSEVQIAAASPAQIVEPEQPEIAVERAVPVPTQEAQPVEETEEIAALVNVPLPTPRPEYTPAAMPRAKQPRPVERQQTQQRQRREQPAERQVQRALQQQGNRGNNQADARRGAADGSEQGRGTRQGTAGNSRQAGNAAISNYPGKVASKLRRSMRIPASARRERVNGDVHVSFTVERSGSVSGIRIARSSGSSIIDQVALDTVRRAAPFPPIPEGAGRSNWPFTMPLGLGR